MHMASKLDRFITKVVGAFSPKRAALREHFRRMEESDEYRLTVFAMMGARGYRNAKAADNQTPWLDQADRSADAEIQNDLGKLRGRSRELNRDDPVGSGLTGSFVNNIVGSGMRPQANTGDLKKNKIIEEVWKDIKDNLFRADRLTFNDGQKMIMSKTLEDGEIFVKDVKRTAQESIWFELVEGDRVMDPLDRKVAEGNELRNGVEKDKDGVPVAYWIKKTNPIDIFTPGKTAAILQPIRIDASVINHLKLVTRPGQTRGVPFFHAVLQDIHDFDLLILASIKRVQIAACLSIFIKSGINTDDMFQVTAQRYGYKLDQQIEPGMIFRLYPNEEIQTLVPNFPVPELEAFIIVLARRIGAALGVSWQIVLKDFGGSNYSSARTDLLESRVIYVVRQKWLKENALNRLWTLPLQDAKRMGDIRLATITPEELAMVEWIANGWKWIDPLKEAQGARLDLMMGITTLKEICGSRGTDWEEILDQRLLEEKTEMDKRKEMGLPEKQPLQEMKPAGRDFDLDDLDQDEVDELLTEFHNNRITHGNGSN